MESLFIGKTIDHYRIVDVIGHGGMGTVFRAVDEDLQRDVALKMMDGRFSSNEKLLYRFRIEGRSQAKLRHPNIVSVYSQRKTDMGFFIVMEYVPGETLATRIKREGPISLPAAITIFKQLLAALEHAHSRGVIHRDIKPGNILIDQHDQVKVTDFGMAKLQEDFGLTKTGLAGGTLFYASPEQIQNLKDADTRSDIYSLGVTLYEMLAGALPFGENETSLQIQLNIIEGRIPPLNKFNPKVPKKLINIVARAMAVEPRKRFQTIDEFRDVIEQFERKYLPKRSFRTFRKSSKRNRHRSGPKKSTPKLKKRFLVSGLVAGLCFLLAYLGAVFDIPGKLPARVVSWFPWQIPLSITSDPPGAAVFVNGSKLGLTPLQNTRVKSGEIRLRILKPDYFTVDTSVNLARNQAAALALDLRPAASMTIKVEPKDADVAFDGQLINLQSLSQLQFSPGGHILTVHRKGYITQTRRLDLVQGMNGPVTFVLEKDPAFVADSADLFANGLEISQVTITSDPPGAIIWLDGKKIATALTPYHFQKITVGPHHVLLQKERYEDYSTLFQVDPENNSPVHAVLRKKPSVPPGSAANNWTGELTVVALPQADIYLNNELQKKNASVFYRSDLPPGEQLIKVVHPTYGAWEKRITVRQNRKRTVAVNFNRFITVPVTAVDENHNRVHGNILLDNQPTGLVTPATLKLRVGLHKIEVQEDGYAPLQAPLVFNLEENFRDSLRVVLKKVPQ